MLSIKDRACPAFAVRKKRVSSSASEEGEEEKKDSWLFDCGYLIPSGLDTTAGATSPIKPCACPEWDAGTRRKPVVLDSAGARFSHNAGSLWLSFPAKYRS